MTVAPDFIEPVEGWRVWSVSERGSGVLRLRSLFWDLVWYPGTPVTATCFHRTLRHYLLRRRPSHDAPEAQCNCGIHAASEPSALLPYLEHTQTRRIDVWRVFGHVALWGEVVECESGWRAQRAYPTHLYLPPPDWRSRRSRYDAATIAAELRAYGVPIEFASLDEVGVEVLEPEPLG